MADDDRQRWNDRYRTAASGDLRPPRPALVTAASLVPAGRALDLACGPGDESVWLARQGWTVDAVDIADEACARTAERARRYGVADRVHVVRADLDTGLSGVAAGGAGLSGVAAGGAGLSGVAAGDAGPSGAGLYDLVWAGHFRAPVLAEAVARLRPGGVLATTRLSVVGRPAEDRADPRFLAAPGELASFAAAHGLIVHLVEEGAGETALVAVRPAGSGS